MTMDKAEIQVVHETAVTGTPVDSPLITILRHRPSGALGVGAAWSIHEARDKAVKMLVDEVDKSNPHKPEHRAPEET